MNFRITKADFCIVYYDTMQKITMCQTRHNTFQAIRKVLNIWKDKNLDAYTVTVIKDSLLGYIYLPSKQDESLPVTDIKVINLLFDL